MALKLTEEQLNWLMERIPESAKSPLGGRPPVNKRKVLRGIFWMLDNGAKWKDLPRRFGSKSTVHRWFQTWVRDGVFENIMREAGRCIEERDGFKLYECFVDGTFAKACGGGDGIGCTKAGKGVKIMVLVDARGLPVSIDTMSASPHESQLIQSLFDFMITEDLPQRVIGDKAYDSDYLDEELAHDGIELIAPHRRNRKAENVTQDCPSTAQVQTTMEGGAYHRLAEKLPKTVHPLGEVHSTVQRLSSFQLRDSVTQAGFGIGSRHYAIGLRNLAAP